MLKWPGKAREAIRKLFEPLQDIDVFVEDANDEAFYRALLTHATGGSVRIARVFELGGKAAVVNAAQVHDHAKRPALFIIDGDLDWVRGVEAPNILGLHRHQAYCVENLLLCESAISTILSQELAKSEQETIQLLGYAEWRASILQPLLELFAAFVTANVHAPALPTVSQGVGRLCTQVAKSRTELDVSRVAQARDALLLEVASAHGDDAAVKETYRQALERIQGLPDPLLAVSGKDFLFPLLHFRMARLGAAVRTKSLRYRLASAGDPRRYSEVASSLRAAANGWIPSTPVLPPM